MIFYTSFTPIDGTDMERTEIFREKLVVEIKAMKRFREISERYGNAVVINI